MGLDDELTHGEAMSIYIGLAIGTLIGGGICAHRAHESQGSNPQTIESTVSQNTTTNQKGTIDYNSLVNKPFRYGNDVWLYEGYNPTTSMFSFRFNNGRTYMNWDQFNSMPWGNMTYISMSTYNGYYPSSNVRMTSRPPGMVRYWDNLNRSTGFYGNNVEANVVYRGDNMFKNLKTKVHKGAEKAKGWFHNHKKNK